VAERSRAAFVVSPLPLASLQSIRWCFATLTAQILGQFPLRVHCFSVPEACPESSPDLDYMRHPVQKQPLWSLWSDHIGNCDKWFVSGRGGSNTPPPSPPTATRPITLAFVRKHILCMFYSDSERSLANIITRILFLIMIPNDKRRVFSTIACVMSEVIGVSSGSRQSLGPLVRAANRSRNRSRVCSRHLRPKIQALFSKPQRCLWESRPHLLRRRRQGPEWERHSTMISEVPGRTLAQTSRPSASCIGCPSRLAAQALVAHGLALHQNLWLPLTPHFQTAKWVNMLRLPVRSNHSLIHLSAFEHIHLRRRRMMTILTAFPECLCGGT